MTFSISSWIWNNREWNKYWGIWDFFSQKVTSQATFLEENPERGKIPSENEKKGIFKKRKTPPPPKKKPTQKDKIKNKKKKA